MRIQRSFPRSQCFENTDEAAFLALFKHLEGGKGASLHSNCKAGGIVSFATPDDAAKKVMVMHLKEVNGKPLTVILTS